MAKGNVPTDRNGVPASAGYDKTNKEVKPLNVSENGSLQINSGPGGNLVETDIGNTVWGIPKVSQDLSIFHGIWTYNIPQSIWHIEENGVELVDNDTSILCISSKGQMEMKCGANIGDITRMRSRRHPRYQPNRGHYLATAGYFPDPNAIGIRKVGFRSNGDGVYFKLEDGVLTGEMINSDGPDKNVILDVPESCDLSCGNLYDIEYQWRGVGNYYFYINQKLVGVIENLGTGSQVTISNPAMAISYEVENKDGTQPEMHFGCIDVTSEGGKKEGNQYIRCKQDLSINLQGRPITGYNKPLIIMRVKDLLYGKKNTRDSILNRISASSDEKSIMKIWYTRDPSAFGGTLYNDSLYETAYPGSSIEYIDCTDLDDTQIIFYPLKALEVSQYRVPADDSAVIGNPSENIEFFVEGDDYLILTGQRENGIACKMFGNIELGEEV